MFGNWPNFNSDLYQLLDLLQQRELSDIPKCKDLYENYYQSTLCLFGDRALMPYTLKVDMLLRLFEMGEFLSPIFSMTEDTEKNHHTAAEVNTKTMRDGGNDAWNKSSSYLDIQFSFYRAIDFCLSKSATLEPHRKSFGKTKTYLEICRGPIPKPELDIALGTEDMFRGMHFVILGINGHMKQTHASLEKEIIKNGGNLLSNVDIINKSRLTFLFIFIAFYQIVIVSTQSSMVNQVKK